MKKGLSITNTYIIIVIIVLITGVLAASRIAVLKGGLQSMQDITEEYIESEEAVHSMRAASDLLTMQSREYVISGGREHLKAYMDEINVDMNRDKALEVLKEYSFEEEAYNALASAVDSSNALAKIEIRAMQLVSVNYGMSKDEITDCFGEYVLTAEDEALTEEEKRNKAIDMMFGKSYQNQKNDILNDSYKSLEKLVENTRKHEIESYEDEISKMRQTVIFFILMVLSFLATILITATQVIRPLTKGVAYIRKSEMLPTKGAEEFVYLAETYNKMLDMTKEHHEQLSYDATHDALTGLYNRKTYENAKSDIIGKDIAMILVDIDDFKHINDTFGHSTGDEVLKRVAEALRGSFRLEDDICRIGGDEFAVIMKNIEPSLEGVVTSKIMTVREKISKQTGIPPVTLSIGVAFTKDAGNDDIFKKADEALYAVKEQGRNGYGFYGHDSIVKNEEIADK